MSFKFQALTSTYYAYATKVEKYQALAANSFLTAKCAKKDLTDEAIFKPRIWLNLTNFFLTDETFSTT